MYFTAQSHLLLLSSLSLTVVHGNMDVADAQAAPHVQTAPANLREFDPIARPFRIGLASATARPPHRTRTRTRPDPIQTSYETSTDVDPETWAHIDDQTYGGLTGPPTVANLFQQDVASSTDGGGEPVQTSYETSTDADPATWRHIDDPTYGGLTAPPPGWPAETTMALGKRQASGSGSSGSGSGSGTRTSSGRTIEITIGGSKTTSTSTKTATRSTSNSGSGSGSGTAATASPQSKASRRYRLPGIFAVFNLF